MNDKNKEKINNNNHVAEEDKALQPDELEVLKNNLQEIEKSNQTLKDQLLRKAAEFENYKKRIENDLINITRFSNQNLVEKLLPVLDDFERFIQHTKDENKNYNEDPFYKGVELIYNKLLKILEQQGLKKMGAVGQPFDVHFHDAMLVIPSNNPETTPNTVIQEIEKGYLLHDRVIRHAKVIVSGEVTEGLTNSSENGAD